MSLCVGSKTPSLIFQSFTFVVFDLKMAQCFSKCHATNSLNGFCIPCSLSGLWDFHNRAVGADAKLSDGSFCWCYSCFLNLDMLAWVLWRFNMVYIKHFSLIFVSELLLTTHLPVT